MPDKTIFISHAHVDYEAYVRPLDEQLHKIFPYGVKIFCSSADGIIGAGDDWLEEIYNSLIQSQIALFLLTPASLTRSWIWYELGVLWERYQNKQVLIAPIYYGLTPKDIIYPFSKLQITPLNDTNKLKTLFERIQHKLDGGTHSPLRLKVFKNLLPYPATLETIKNPNPEKRLEEAIKALIKTNTIKKADLGILRIFDLLPSDALREIEEMFD